MIYNSSNVGTKGLYSNFLSETIIYSIDKVNYIIRSCIFHFFSPTGHLQDYLDHMEEIDEAIKFFEKNNPESSQLAVLVSRPLKWQSNIFNNSFFKVSIVSIKNVNILKISDIIW